MVTHTMSTTETANLADAGTMRRAAPAPAISKFWSAILIFTVLMFSWLVIVRIL